MGKRYVLTLYGLPMLLDNPTALLRCSGRAPVITSSSSGQRSREKMLLYFECPQQGPFTARETVEFVWIGDRRTRPATVTFELSQMMDERGQLSLL